MKKLLLLLVVLSIFVSLVGCGPKVGIGEVPGKEPSDGAPSGAISDTSKINGAELSEFSIVYSASADDYTKRAAEYINKEVKERTGLELPLVDDTAPAAAHEIVVGETNRNISKRLSHKGELAEFSVLARGGSVAMEADYFVIAAAAYFFVSSYVPSDNFAASVPEKTCAHMPVAKPAKNFIILIGDGMGVYQTRLFEVMENDIEYGDGEDIFYGYYLPYYAYSRTNSLSGVTDSAAGGTALSTGYKTINGYVGQNKDHKELLSITELAASIGKSTAVMSTESSTGATPASFSAHANDRDLEADIRADQQVLKQNSGTIINCGYNQYHKYGVGQIEDRVIETLDTLDNDEQGFFLMYEEAYIDKHSHNNNMENAFEALVRFNQVIARFMEYAYYNPETAVIITADHETGDLKPDSNGDYAYGSEEHSGADVPVFAHGYGMSVFNGETVENVQIPKTFAALMGVKDFGDQSTHPSLIK